MRRLWTLSWLALTAAIMFETSAKWCYGKVASVKAEEIASDRMAQAAAGAIAEVHIHTGEGLAIAGLAAAVVGCVAWGVAVRRKEAGRAVISICLIAAYARLSLVMV